MDDLKIERISGNEIKNSPKLWSHLFTFYNPINDLLASGVEVYCTLPIGSGLWVYEQPTTNELVTQKALLINIQQPIKRETASDVLRLILEENDNPTTPNRTPYYDRAKAALENEVEGE